MIYWRIKVFIKDRGTDVIREWLKDMPRGAQIEVNTRLRYLRTLKTWKGRPLSAKRKGTGDIYEIIISWNKNQYRPLGFFGPKEDEFTLLIGAQEKDWKLEPKNADEIAERRRKLILEGGDNIDDYFKEI
ncbi:MAG: type II toxin-antitoxin system RelE/ParE family toxin [Thermodesulfovibrionales bacterium]|jgi:hypothetical protein